MSWANYDAVLGELQAHGLRVEALDIGRLQRCFVEGEGREKRGWYVLHELHTGEGETLLVGSYGIWRGDDSGAVKITPKGKPLSAEQRAAMRERAREDRRRLEAARKREADAAAAKAARAWASFEPADDHEYLRRKRVTAEGAKLSKQGALVLPMHDARGGIRGLQIIRPRAAAESKGRPEKEYWPRGLAKQGSMCLLGVPDWVVLVTEGYATGRSLRMATDLPVAVAWDAGNLLPVCQALRKRYRRARILVCADDDRLAKCGECSERLDLAAHPTDCPACGRLHRKSNTGVARASEAALAVGGEWTAPRFADDAGRVARFLERGHKLTDYNDLHCTETLAAAGDQIHAKLDALAWRPPSRNAPAIPQGGGGDAALRPIATIDEVLQRFALVYGKGGVVFDAAEHALISLQDLSHLCCSRDLYRAWGDHPARRIVRPEEVGFDPGGEDAAVTCNLWGGWPTTPQAGNCELLLELLQHMCSADPASTALYDWVLSWLAYPLQHPGAKMKTALVIHGPQGTGKNLFFEAVMAIYGQYGRMIGQEAVEDKFNDWASRKLFLIADEVVARSDLYHVKNKLKSFITGDWIRINPKNIQAYDERNHVNMVFLSNEVMPVVLEQDDRRHAVIWTPAKLDPDFYGAVKREIAAGGIAALHHHLLHLDLGDFGEASAPPSTKARADLIRSSLDSTSEFLLDLQDGQVGEIPYLPSRKADLYRAYRHWCLRVGVKPAPEKRLSATLELKHHVDIVRKRYAVSGHVTPYAHRIYLLSDRERERFPTEQEWLGWCVTEMGSAINEYCGGNDG